MPKPLSQNWWTTTLLDVSIRGMARRRKPNKGRQQPTPSPSENSSTRILDALAGHWLTPTIMGAVLTFTGPGNILIQVPVLLLCGVWICCDVWVLIKKHSMKLGLWKNLLVSLSCSVILCAASGISIWLIGQSFDKEQKETRVGLVANALSPPTLSPLESIFTIANGSTHQIGGHSFKCGINLVVYNQGNGFLSQFSTTKQDFFDGKIEGNGDTQSYKCLDLFKATREQMDCLDVVAHFEYSIETQPNITETKEFRFVADKEDGFVWTKQPLNDPKQYCLDHMSSTGRASLEAAEIQQKLKKK